jgi:hypothetical protein
MDEADSLMAACRRSNSAVTLVTVLSGGKLVGVKGNGDGDDVANGLADKEAERVEDGAGVCVAEAEGDLEAVGVVVGEFGEVGDSDTDGKVDRGQSPFTVLTAP